MKCKCCNKRINNPIGNQLKKFYTENKFWIGFILGMVFQGFVVSVSLIAGAILGGVMK